MWDVETEGARAGLKVAVSRALTLTDGLRHESRTVKHRPIEGAGAVPDEEVETTDHDGTFGTLVWRPRRDLSLNVSYEDSSYDDPYTQASPTDRSRFQAKGRWGATAGWWRTWNLTVFSVTPRETASLRFEVTPPTISSSTSRSRSVRASGR